MSHALLDAATEQAATLVGESRQYLTFALAEELYAISIRRVREILEFRNLTEVPLMPGFLRGVTNLRGLVIPVVDLQERFGIGHTEIGPRTCIVVVEVDSEEERTYLGILVNAVHEVLPIEPDCIGPRPTFGPRIRVDFIEALLDVGKGFMIALDLSHVLSLDEMSEIASRWNENAAVPALPG